MLADEVKSLGAALAQASRYGEQVRLLENQSMDKERAKVRAAWVTFRTQFHGDANLLYINNAYHVEYAKTKEKRYVR